MENSMIFAGIDEKDLAEMLDCFQMREEKFGAGETILRYGKSPVQIGVLMEGEAQLVRYDYDGNCAILERLEQNSVFGELFSLPLFDDDLQVRCEKDCRVLFLNYQNVVTRCGKGCRRHDRFLANMLTLISRKVQFLSARLEVLSQRSIRGKILRYFELLSRRAGSKKITIPFSMSGLADYLCVDRSAMLREMKKLREEKLLESAGKHVRLP